jgi:hypothetical protein
MDMESTPLLTNPNNYRSSGVSKIFADRIADKGGTIKKVSEIIGHL